MAGGKGPAFRPQTHASRRPPGEAGAGAHGEQGLEAGLADPLLAQSAQKDGDEAHVQGAV